MKDKIFIPSLILTLSFLIVFMLICIRTQAASIKELSGRLERSQAENVKIQQTLKQQEISLKQQELKQELKKEADRFKAENAKLKDEIGQLRNELEKAKSAPASKKQKSWLFF